MGHQVTIFATPKDLDSLASAILNLEPALFLRSRSATMEPVVVPSLNVVDEGHPWLFYHIVRERDLPAVVTRHVPAQGYWVVDIVRSPTVEVDGCYFDREVLRRGRFYYVDGFYGADSSWVEKSDGFLGWAESVVKTAKKTLKRRGSDYVGADALAWVARDQGRLVT